MKNFIQNLKLYKLWVLQLVLFSVIAIAIAFFIPIIAAILIQYDLNASLESIGVFLLLLFFLVAETLVAAFLLRMNIMLVLDLAQELPVRELVITDKKTVSGRQRTWHFLSFAGYESKFQWLAGTSDFNKLGKGKSYNFILLPRSELVLPAS